MDNGERPIMQVAIFVAGEDSNPTGRDSEEFSRYYIAFKEKFKEKFRDVSSNRKKVGRYRRGNDNSTRHLLYKSDQNDFAVMVVDKNETLKRVTNEVKVKGVFDVGDCENVLKAVAEWLPLVDGRDCDFEVSLFVHWHIEACQAECSFNKCIGNIGVDNVRKLAHVTKFEQFAVSSRRKDQFNLKPVSGVINIPLTPKDLDALKAKFSADPKVLAEKNGIELHSVKQFDVLKFEKQAFVLIPAESSAWMDSLCGAICKLFREKGISCLDPNEFVDFPSLPALVFPLFITWDNADKVGSTVPEEFIIRYGDSMTGDDILSELSLRMQQWMFERDLKNGVSLDVLKELCCSMFRRYIFLDEDVHADSNIDYSLLNKGILPDDGIEKISFRLQKKDRHYKLWRALFADVLNILEEIMVGNANGELCVLLQKQIKGLTPNGMEIVFSVPERRLKALILDDNISDQKERFNDDCLKEVFRSIEYVEARRDNLNAVIKTIRKLSKDHCCFDVALVDLNLKDGAGQDPSGYQLINILKIFYPSVPIVAYSRYDDMGHISRAFKSGAHWFVRKNDVGKLPRHLLSMHKHKDWGLEWNTIKEMVYRDNTYPLCEIEKDKDGFGDKFSDERQFLTYKCMDKFPGDVVYIRPMSGGFSSAVTFKAVKGKFGEIEDGHQQTPVIIKIDTYYNTMSEYERYFRFIRPYIANESGRVEFPEVKLDNEHSAITYTFAGKSGSSRCLMTMKERMKQDVRNLATCDFDRYGDVFDELFNDVLPRIHAVGTDKECDERFSSFPNPSFGEVDVERGGFVANYLKRMAIARHVSDAKFVAEGGFPLEFHGFARDMKSGREMIESYDYADGIMVLLQGVSANHFAKFRNEILPGRTLRISGYENGIKSVISAEQDDEILKYVALDMLYIGSIYKKGEDAYATVEEIRSCVLQGVSAGGFEVREDRADEFRNVLCRSGMCIKNEVMHCFSDLLPRDCHSDAKCDFNAILKMLYDNISGFVDMKKADLRLPVGIIHGDLNYANIMLDDDGKGTDVWLIDFARTRRDVIAHDFNVMFTSTIALLFDNELWKNDRPVLGAENYRSKVKKIFPYLIEDAIFGGLSDVEPDYIADDKRFILIYKILQRIRRAAEDCGMNTESYAVTTALCCLYTFRIMLKYEHSIPAAAAMLAITSMIYNKLTEREEKKP